MLPIFATGPRVWFGRPGNRYSYTSRRRDFSIFDGSQTDSGVYPASYSMSTEDLTPRKYSSQAVKLISHFRPLLRLRMSERRNLRSMPSRWLRNGFAVLFFLLWLSQWFRLYSVWRQDDEWTGKNMEEVITTYFEIRSQTYGGTEEKRATPMSGLRVKIVNQISRTWSDSTTHWSVTFGFANIGQPA